ncbi:MAG: hypothetical protein MI919_13370 [Holophagales bacterium]|nr:hypothetical protein [Holophagales bacterium]
MSRRALSQPALLAVISALMLWQATGPTLAQPTPLSCSSPAIRAFGAQGLDTDIFQIPGNLDFALQCAPAPAQELNNLCHRSTDGLLYAVQLKSGGNDGVVTIDASCNVSAPLVLTGAPLPSGRRFDAGDCLPDGSQMFINRAGNRDEFFVLDLQTRVVTKLVTSFPSWRPGIVNDWAYNPTDGKLYGGDSTHGELAVVELLPDPFQPTSATRVDLPLAGLPSGSSSIEAYGGAWFDTTLDRLFLHRNNGVVYEIDVSVPTIVATHMSMVPAPSIPSSERNDSAPCRCDEAYFIQDEPDAVVYRCDPSRPALACARVCGPLDGREINNAGFNKDDGLLYAVELDSEGNSGLIRMDPNASCGSIESAQSKPLPTGVRFDAGDISPDGSTLYVNVAGDSPLYVVDLTTWPHPTATSLAISGQTGNVRDWAYNPADGKLYGGDIAGEMAVLTIGQPVMRADTNVTGLPSGTAFGGAWFDSAGHLVLHRNDGNIYRIDISGPTLLSTTTARGSTRNEGAVCVR